MSTRCNLLKMRLFLSLTSRSLHTVFTRSKPASASAAATPGVVLSEPSSVSASLDLKQMVSDIHASLASELHSHSELKCLAQYYFDGQGKCIRPVIAMTLSHALNAHLNPVSLDSVVCEQRQVSLVSEMIHTASLVHDDVLDKADSRRGKVSLNRKWDARRSVFTGDFVLAVASRSLAALGNEQVLILLAQVLEDLVKGELQQLESVGDSTSRFELYMQKTFNKTASLIAHTCRASALLAGGDNALCEKAFDFGRNLGVAFQLIDDLLDFQATSDQLGKPAHADLTLGLATAPVLFAVNEHPELEKLIRRRFNQQGDIDVAFQAVQQSNGMQRTRQLAQRHCDAALQAIEHLKNSSHKWALVQLADNVVNRKK